MSVLINMEMPTTGMCKTITIFDDGAVVEGNGSEKLGKAVPVPPHGRLIDADELMKRMWEETDCMISVPATFVRDAPTVIEADGGE